MKILLGTKNLGKINEFKSLFKEEEFDLISLNDLNHQIDDEPVENGLTYFDNALIKAKYYYDKFHIPCLCDDSGLEVYAINGAPGVKSARLGEKKTDKERRHELLKQLSGKENLSAQFICQLILYDGHNIIESRGFVKGEIKKLESGNNGFGYDPIFYLKEFNQTMAELSLDEKNQVSHRAMAVKNILPRLKTWVNAKKHITSLEEKIVSITKEIYQTEDVEIINRLSGGMSNYTYVIKVNNFKKVFRLPGENAEKFVNRKIEISNLQIISQFMDVPKIDYFDIASGIKITPYVEGVSLHTCEDYDLNDIVLILKKLHQSDKLAVNDYDPFSRIFVYENYCRALGYHHPDEYNVTKTKLFQFKNYLESLPKVLCHGDAQRSNFVKKADNQIMLVDYEFCGNNDYFYDIACFGNREFQKGLDLLDCYLGRKATLEELRRLTLWHAFQALQWYNVAIYKDLTGLSATLGFDFLLIAKRYLHSCDENCNRAIEITKTLSIEN